MPANASKASYVVSPTTIVVTSGVVRTSDLVRSSGLTYRIQLWSPTALRPSTMPSRVVSAMKSSGRASPWLTEMKMSLGSR